MRAGGKRVVPKVRSRGPAQTAATVARVLDAAARVFAVHGVRGGSIHAIARQSRTSIGSIYHHFGDRDGVAVALYQRTLDDLLAHVADAFLVPHDARAALDAMVDAYLSWVQQHRSLARFLFFAGPAELDAERHGPLDATKVARMAPMFARVGTLIAAGVLRPMPPPILEVIVVGPMAEFARRLLGGSLPWAELRPGSELIKECLWRTLAV